MFLRFLLLTIGGQLILVVKRHMNTGDAPTILRPTGLGHVVFLLLAFAVVFAYSKYAAIELPISHWQGVLSLCVILCGWTIVIAFIQERLGSVVSHLLVLASVVAIVRFDLFGTLLSSWRDEVSQFYAIWLLSFVMITFAEECFSSDSVLVKHLFKIDKTRTEKARKDLEMDERLEGLQRRVEELRMKQQKDDRDDA